MKIFVNKKKNDPKLQNNSSIMKKNKSKMPEYSAKYLEEEEILNV